MEYLQKFIDDGWLHSDIAEMIGIKDANSIGRWLLYPGKPNYRKMPKPTARLLMILWKYPQIREELKLI